MQLFKALSDLFTSAQDFFAGTPVVKVDNFFSIKHANRPARKILGNNAIGKNIFMLLDTENVGHLIEAAMFSRLDERTRSHRTTYRGKEYTVLVLPKGQPVDATIFRFEAV